MRRSSRCCARRPIFRPSRLVQRLREFQAANGRLEIINARFQQGDLIVDLDRRAGADAARHAHGELQLTVINFAKLIPLLGIDRVLAQMVPQETRQPPRAGPRPGDAGPRQPAARRQCRPIGRHRQPGKRRQPGQHGQRRERGSISANASAAALGAAALGGRQTELEGQRAVTLVLRVRRRHGIARPAQVRPNPAAVLKQGYFRGDAKRPYGMGSPQQPDSGRMANLVADFWLSNS